MAVIWVEQTEDQRMNGKQINDTRSRPWSSLRVPFGVLLLFGFTKLEPAGLAQNSLAVDPAPAVAKDDAARRWLESTRRNAPVCEKLSAIPLVTKCVRGIFRGFEQGAGIGGVQLTSADVVAALELRATALTATRYCKRYDLKGYFE
jgi:hypothetical protein